MNIRLRALTFAAIFTLAASTAASANTVELTLTVPLKITLPTAGNGGTPGTVQGGAGLTLAPFDVNCVVGTGLGYATGSGAQGTIAGTGSTALSGSKTVQDATGKISSSPKATVIITYDDGLSSAVNRAGVNASKVGQYLCWVQWRTPIPSLAPIFVQGTTTF